MALRLRRDANHDIAVRLWTPGRPILTTNHVVGETWTFLVLRRERIREALAFDGDFSAAGFSEARPGT